MRELRCVIGNIGKRKPITHFMGMAHRLAVKVCLNPKRFGRGWCA
jgi:hypothetical protein